MTPKEIKEEIKVYTKVMETNYTEKITSLQMSVEKLKKAAQTDRIKNVSKVTEKSDLENLFVDCVENTRKDIIKRRLKAEIAARQNLKNPN